MCTPMLDLAMIQKAWRSGPNQLTPSSAASHSVRVSVSLTAETPILKNTAGFNSTASHSPAEPNLAGSYTLRVYLQIRKRP